MKFVVLLTAVFQNMIEQLKYIVQRTWELLTSTAVTWDIIETEDDIKNNTFKSFVLPWIIFCAIVVFVFKLMYATERGFETSLVTTIITTISLYGGYLISRYVANWYINRKYPKIANQVNTDKVISYSFSAIFVLKIVTAVFPGLFFLQILNIYTAFLVWDSCRAIFKLNEEERANLVVILTAVIIFSPVLISSVVNMMLPNI